MTRKRHNLKSSSPPVAKDLLTYADQDQPWLSEIPNFEITNREQFINFETEVVVLTAVNTERDMVLRCMRPLSGRQQIAKVTAGPDTFYVGLLGQHQTVLVMAEPGAIGRSASILTTSDAIKRWNPKAVIAVGFAFGMHPDKQEIADVLISKTVTSYEPQRVRNDGTIPRGSTVESGQHLLNRFVNVHGWEFRRPDGQFVRAKAGQILSGEKLVDSVAFKNSLLERYPEALGGEMEGAGLFAAADRAKVEWIVVKAICDWGDGNKHKRYQPLAAAAAVSLVKHVLSEDGPLSDLKRPRQSGHAVALQTTPLRLHEIPPSPHDFTGREEELKELMDAIEHDGVRIAGLRGPGGVGKTVLAQKLAELLMPSYPDAQFYLNLKGLNSNPVPVSEALSHIIRAYCPTAILPGNEDELRGLYQSVLHGKHAILLMDNAAGAAQVEPLIPPPTCTLLVTSRQHFRLPGLFAKKLDSLAADDARSLLVTITPRIGDLADEIATLCANLPLALRLVANALSNFSNIKPMVYAKRLKDAQQRLKLVEASLSLSYELLSKELQSLWSALAVFPGTFDKAAAAAIWNLKVEPAEEKLAELLTLSLLEWNETTDRYRLHDLVQLFALKKLGRQKDIVAKRHSSYYLDVFKRANDLYYKGGAAVNQGLALFDLEWDNIRAGQAWASQHLRIDPKARSLCLEYADVGSFVLMLRHDAQETILWLKTALTAIRGSNDPDARLRLLNELGKCHGRLGARHKEVQFYKRALAISQKLGDRHARACVLGNLASAYSSLGQSSKSLKYLTESYEILRQVGDRRNEAFALSSLAKVHTNLGDSRLAQKLYEEQLDIAHEIGDIHQEASALCDLSYLYFDRKEYHQAIELNNQALTIAREMGDRENEAGALSGLGHAYMRLGERQRAIAFQEQALLIARKIGDKGIESGVLNSLGAVYWDLGENTRAIEFYKQALSLDRETGDAWGESTALGNLGLVLHEIGNLTSAIACVELALNIRERLKDPNTAILRDRLVRWRRELH